MKKEAGRGYVIRYYDYHTDCSSYVNSGAGDYRISLNLQGRIICK